MFVELNKIYYNMFKTFEPYGFPGSPVRSCHAGFLDHTLPKPPRGFWRFSKIL